MIEIIPNWHPLLVHFTIALLVTSAALFVLSALFKTHHWRGQWLTAANWNLWIGSGFAVLTVLAGWYAYNTVAHDTPSHVAMTTHRNWALVTTAVVLALALWSVLRYRASRLPHAPFLAAVLLSAALLLITGWHGAEAVYRYGLGVMALPKAEGDGHAHEHAEGEGHDTDVSAAHEDDGHAHDAPAPATADQQPAGATSPANAGADHAADPSGSQGRVHTHADGTVERH